MQLLVSSCTGVVGLGAVQGAGAAGASAGLSWYAVQGSQPGALGARHCLMLLWYWMSVLYLCLNDEHQILRRLCPFARCIPSYFLSLWILFNAACHLNL